MSNDILIYIGLAGLTVSNILFALGLYVANKRKEAENE